MRELEPSPRWDMASPGNAAAPSSCLPSQCFDLLTRACVRCSDLFKDNATEPARAVPTSTLVPTLPSADLPSTLLIFGVPVAVVVLLALAALWGFLACKVGKQRRKRKVVDEEGNGNTGTSSSLPSPGCQDPAVPEREAALALAPCPHINGGLKVPGTPQKAGSKRGPCCQGGAEGDMMLLSSVYPRSEERHPSFPLPATELGATVLVTTKTTQNCA